MAVAISNPPEQGQPELVTVRQRHYVVADVNKSTLPDRPLRSSGNGAQHPITLSSFEVEPVPARFANPQPGMFPMAVTFLVLERLARG